MNSFYHSYVGCYVAVMNISNIISTRDKNELHYACQVEEDMENNNKYSQPMVWIGIYIAIASWFCIFAMAADLLHGFRNKKLWFPSKYFTLNAASITVISVSMKLPVDLSSPMPSYKDQAAKLGSLALMCTMMANLMPSLASMNNSSLFANVIGLSILTITMIVNVVIQINTGVINEMRLDQSSSFLPELNGAMVAYIYTSMILVLLLIIISSSLTIPTSKEILEFKYQATNKASLTDQRLQDTHMSMVEKLREYVTRYWVMAETGSPQFVMASSPLSTASGVICLVVLLLNLLVVLKNSSKSYRDGIPSMAEEISGGSPYKGSIFAILITQSIGVVVGSIAPIFRCFSVLNYKLITEWNRNHFMFFKVEKYWTQRLYDWKQSYIPFLSNSRRSRTFVYNFKNTILSHWIRMQKVTVVFCKLIWLIPVVCLKIVVYCVYRCKSLKAKLLTPPMSPRSDSVNEELRNYVLQIHDEMELAEKILKGILNSMNSFILKAEKKQNNNLVMLLEKSTGFNGVGSFDSEHVDPLLPVELVNSWSLPIVTMTCIAVSLPNIQKDRVDNLVRSVGEGLWYVYHVEESLNSESEYVNIRKATMTIWHEVENNKKWLETPLVKEAFTGKTTTEIVKWFADKAKEIVIEIKKVANGETMQKPPKNLIAANSMYRVAETILLRDQRNTELRDEELFVLLTDMIADVLSAGLTNIPRVIITKCQESVIEKREASVKVAAKLLGETRKIIERLEARVLPSMDPDKMAYVDDWRHYLKQSIP